MYLKYSLGFLFASLVQAAIIMTSELLNISTLGAKLTVSQLITHIIAGQVAGYILLIALRKVSALNEINTWIIGSIFGAMIWAVLLPINSMQGTIRAPWTQGISTVVSSMFAFIIYGIIATYTIKKYGYREVKT